jgi:hypothetical protein
MLKYFLFTNFFVAVASAVGHKTQQRLTRIGLYFLFYKEDQQGQNTCLANSVSRHKATSPFASKYFG